MSAAAPEYSAAPVVDNRHIVRALIASCLGWSLDLFDLFVLLYVAPVVGRLFFPSEHAMLSLAAVYASFAVTLLMRPVGSALFGSYADRHGRKGAMTVAVIGVGIATATFGLLPTVAQIGVAAPILFLLLRLVQGIFVGGVVASTHTIGTESVPARYRGLASGLIGGGGAGIGALIASITYLIMSSIFPGPAFDAWGWRCMFFTGILSSVLGVFIFNMLEESPLWKHVAEQKRLAAAARGAKGEVTVIRSPLKTLFSRDYRKILMVNLLLTIGGGSGYYLTSGYLPTFLKVINKVPNRTAAVILILSSVAVIIGSISAGQLSTWIGRRRAFLLLGVIRIVLFPACFLLMASSTEIVMIGLYAAILGALGSASYAPVLIYLNERFPTAIRATGTGLSWNIGFAIGGMMPTFVSLFAKTPGEIPMTLAYFLIGISVIFLIGAFITPETIGNLDRVEVEKL
jgi:MHS family proline/betaine transporter-like MFS transporter